jgi:hypothetical protein
MEEDQKGLLWCEGCLSGMHRSCVAVDTLPTRRGPWYCHMCRHIYREKGLMDITLDEAILRYLSHGELPKDVRQEDRVRRAANFAELDAAGKVWLRGSQDAPARLIPGLGSRRPVMEHAFKEGVYPSGDRLYEVLKISYFWSGMKADCRALAHTSLAR